MQKNYVGRCVDCENYGNCEAVDNLKRYKTDKSFQKEVTTPKPCPDYEFVGEQNVWI